MVPVSKQAGAGTTRAMMASAAEAGATATTAAGAAMAGAQPLLARLAQPLVSSPHLLLCFDLPCCCRVQTAVGRVLVLLW